MEYIALGEKVRIVKADITKIKADAIVNAANSGLYGGGGVDGAIHRAGGPSIMEECTRIRQARGGCPTGEAVITTAGNLSARYVIHTVGPIWQDGLHGEPDLLRSCYRSSLRLAVDNGLQTIAFPNISTGVYRFPKALAAEIAVDEVLRFLEEEGRAKTDRIKLVTFVCYDNENYGIYSEIARRRGTYYCRIGRTAIDVVSGTGWYHGSPLELEVLRAGSSVTRNEQLAEAFSHKPTRLSISDDGVISHNGRLDGYLYVVDEQLSLGDLRLHGACDQDDPWEWVTTRDLRLRLVRRTHLRSSR